MKTAWILPGGGAHAAYTAGAVVAAHDAGLPEPEIIIASSGSSGTAGYYLAGQYSSIRHIWCELLSTRKFGNPFRFWKLMDIDYLVDQVVRRQDPLNLGALMKSNTSLLIPMTDAVSGRVRYFSIHEGFDFYELLRAANAAPYLSGIFKDKKFIADGSGYFDTRVSSRPAQNIQKAISLGAERIIIFDNYHPNSSWTSGRFWYRAWLYLQPRAFRKCHQALLKHESVSVQGVEIVHLKPQAPLPMAVWTNSRRGLEAAYECGHKDASEQLSHGIFRLYS